MRRRGFVVGAGVLFVGCAQILGIDDREVGAPVDASSDAVPSSDATTDAADGAVTPGSDGAATDGAQTGDAGIDAGDAAIGSEAGDAGDAGDASDAPVLTPCDAGDAGDGGLFDLARDPSHCGACGTICTNPSPKPNTAPVCVASACGVACTPGWAHCSDAGVGCELDVTGDPANCGACAHACGGRNTTGGAKCTAGACVFQCSSGTAHCSSSDSDGCETTIASDPSNCGACGFSCGSAACVNGICRLTAGAEKNQPRVSDGATGLLGDGTTLYWGNDEGLAAASTHLVRKVNVDGTALGNVSPDSTYGPFQDQGTSITLDSNYLYYFWDTYGGTPVRLNKSGAQQAAPLDITPGLGPAAVNIITNGDATHAATHVFFAQTLNNTGLWRFPIASPATRSLVTAKAVGGMVFVGTTLYFTSNTDKAIFSYDTALASPPTNQVASFGQSLRALVTDGTHLFTFCDDAKLYQVTIATGAKLVLASSTSYGALATDGVNVYAGVGNLHRVPVDNPNGSLALSNYLMIPTTQLPVSSNVNGILLQGNAVYFSTYTDVYKAKK